MDSLGTVSSNPNENSAYLCEGDSFLTSVIRISPRSSIETMMGIAMRCSADNEATVAKPFKVTESELKNGEFNTFQRPDGFNKAGLTTIGNSVSIVEMSKDPLPCVYIGVRLSTPMESPVLFSYVEFIKNCTVSRPPTKVSNSTTTSTSTSTTRTTTIGSTSTSQPKPSNTPTNVKVHTPGSGSSIIRVGMLLLLTSIIINTVAL